MLSLTIYGRLDGLNEYTKANRSSEILGAEMKRSNEEIVTAYIMQQFKNVKTKRNVSLDFRWYEKNKRRDKDNICFAKKFILDAFVKNKIIANDGWSGVESFTDKFYIDKKNPRIEVDIKGE